MILFIYFWLLNVQWQTFHAYSGRSFVYVIDTLLRHFSIYCISKTWLVKMKLKFIKTVWVYVYLMYQIKAYLCSIYAKSALIQGLSVISMNNK